MKRKREDDDNTTENRYTKILRSYNGSKIKVDPEYTITSE